MTKLCALCGTDKFITFHHLIPKSCHTNKWFTKHFDKTDMRSRGIAVCRRCHAFIHKKFPEKMLGRELNTLELLKQNPVIHAYLKWARHHR